MSCEPCEFASLHPFLCGCVGPEVPREGDEIGGIEPVRVVEDVQVSPVALHDPVAPHVRALEFDDRGGLDPGASEVRSQVPSRVAVVVARGPVALVQREGAAQGVVIVDAGHGKGASDGQIGALDRAAGDAHGSLRTRSSALVFGDLVGVKERPGNANSANTADQRDPAGVVLDVEPASTVAAAERGGPAVALDSLRHDETIRPDVARVNSNSTAPSGKSAAAGLREKLQGVTRQAYAYARACERAVGSFFLFFRSAWVVVFPGTPLELAPPGAYDHIREICDTVQAQLEDRWKAKRAGRPAGDRPWHKQATLEALVDAFTMRAQNVLINVPPRSLKTTILTFATVWAWLHEPTMRILYLSANPTVLEDSARWAQTLMLSPFMASTVQASLRVYRGRTSWTLRPDQTALKNFGTTAGGARIARGMESNITGSGADWIIVDDPHDVRDSEEQIRTTCAGYDAALHNRINDPRTSIRTAIMQRFRVDDFSGHVLTHHGKGVWLHIRRPTEFRTHTTCQCGTCTGPNPYGFGDTRTLEGQPIHPRYTSTFLAQERRRLGPYGYAGQHDQEPSPPSGGMWKTRWYEWFRLPEDPVPGIGVAWHRPHGANEHPCHVLTRQKNRRLFELVSISVDGTFGNLKEHEGSAVGLAPFARLPGQHRWHMLDDQTEPISYLDALVRIREMITTWYDETSAMSVLVEPKAFGPIAVEQLRRDLARGKWRHPDTDELHELRSKSGRRCIVRVEVVRGADVDGEGRKGVMGDKVTRFYAATPELAAGMLALREGCAWVPAVVGETAQFPKGSRDDRVDIITQVINHYGEASSLTEARNMLRI